MVRFLICTKVVFSTKVGFSEKNPDLFFKIDKSSEFAVECVSNDNIF